MSVVSSVLWFVVDASLGGWLGAMAFFSFVAAPRTFAVLDREAAGRVVNDIFPRYYLIGVLLGIVAGIAALVTGLWTGVYGIPTLVVLLSAAIAVTVTSYARWVLIPAMAAEGDGAFSRYHRRSVVLNALAIGLVLIGLFAAHLPGAGG